MLCVWNCISFVLDMGMSKYPKLNKFDEHNLTPENELPVTMDIKYNNLVLFANHWDNSSLRFHWFIEWYNWYKVKPDGIILNIMDKPEIVDNALLDDSSWNDKLIQNNASGKVSLKWIVTANNAPIE